MKPLQQIPIPLLEWYQDNARNLPWREDTPNAYHVWVSEIMLQQTRVTAVLGYYARFMQALPTIADLANISEDALLKLWQGLGYYSRARNLQKAAQEIMTRFGGEFPSAYADIRSLPGIGDYTAAAISSIVYGQPYPAVDGNLLRVSARISGDHDDISATKTKKKITAALGDIIPARQPGAFNQAMMDLGATICLPNGAPHCHHCPLSAFCVAFQTEQTGILPVKAPKKPRRIEERSVFLFFHQGCVALRRRPDRGLLAKLWEFPNELGDDTLPYLASLGISKAPDFSSLGRHIFTHIEWHMTAYTMTMENDALPPDWVWADAAAFHQQYAVPSAFADFFPILDAHWGQAKPLK